MLEDGSLIVDTSILYTHLWIASWSIPSFAKPFLFLAPNLFYVCSCIGKNIGCGTWCHVRADACYKSCVNGGSADINNMLELQPFEVRGKFGIVGVLLVEGLFGGRRWILGACAEGFAFFLDEEAAGCVPGAGFLDPSHADVRLLLAVVSAGPLTGLLGGDFFLALFLSAFRCLSR